LSSTPTPESLLPLPKRKLIPKQHERAAVVINTVAALFFNQNAKHSINRICKPDDALCCWQCADDLNGCIANEYGSLQSQQANDYAWI
jgi:hypothetical protein